MAAARFNPPPNWPVQPGWAPPHDWQPDPHWPPAPIGWQFWVDDNSEHSTDAVGTCETSMPAAASMSRKRWLVYAAVTVAIALVGGTVVAFTRWNDAPETSELPSGMVAFTYPTEPDFTWKVTAKDTKPDAADIFSAPIHNLGPATGAIIAGDHVIVRPWSTSSSFDTTSLMSLSLIDGHTEWSRTTNSALVCGTRTMGAMLPCLTDHEGTNRTGLEFIDTANGKTIAKGVLPFNASLIESDGSNVYTAGIDLEARAFTVAKGSLDNPAGSWKTTIPAGNCSGYALGDSWDFGVANGLVWGFLGGEASAVLRAADGSALFDHAVADAWIAAGPAVVTRRCEQGVDDSSWQTDVTDADGQRLFTTKSLLQQPHLAVYRGTAAPLLNQSGDAFNARNGQRLWHAELPTQGPFWPLIVGQVVMWPGDDELIAYDVQSGQRLWRRGGAAQSYWRSAMGALTDGVRIFLPSGTGGIDALTIADGTQAWSMSTPTDSTEPPAIYGTPRGIVVVTGPSIGLLPATGPPASVPSIDATDDSRRAGSGTKLVTKCGSPPEFVPQTIRVESGELVITTKIVAKCPGGDVLSANQTRITVTSVGQNIASGIFDLSATPIVIDPGNGASDDPSVTHDFRFPIGTFWRLPVSIGEVPTGGATQQGQVDLNANSLLIDCQQDGTTESSAPSENAVAAVSESSVAAGPANPKTGDGESASLDALRAIANADHPFVAANLADRWVPQLSSKRPGLVADGITWNNSETLREHLELRLRYPEVRLLWSGDWSTFSAPDFWITIAGVTFPDAGGALAWCRGHNLDRDHCYAKLVSTSHPIDDSTAFNN
ncbi:PQQ-binding-like beta-propeller repeat protein [Mycobacterium sp. NBC_00419]|uniref:outer membrane protein assembly factor BamB family protein n=1 Tax=Mycobacterium sp. NBC_00419 TaxID=2975989 RepID=UPI002E1D729C